MHTSLFFDPNSRLNGTRTSYLLILNDKRRPTPMDGPRCLLYAVVVQLLGKWQVGPGQDGVPPGRRGHGGRVDRQLQGKGRLEVRPMAARRLREFLSFTRSREE